MLGVIATLGSSLLSSIASVFFERTLKGEGADPIRHLVSTNLHLAIVSLPFVFPPAVSHPWKPIDAPLLLVSAISGIGGLLVAWVTQRSGSVHKCLATALSIVVGVFWSTLFLGFRMSIYNGAGILLTIGACRAYSLESNSQITPRFSSLPL